MGHTVGEASSMQDLTHAFQLAFDLVFSVDPDLFEIIGLSLRVSLTAVAIAFDCEIGSIITA